MLADSEISLWAEFVKSGARRGGRTDIGTHAVVYASTASTNDLCWSIVGDLENAERHCGLVVLADHQTAGRGRRGNHWVAGPGQSVLMSVLMQRQDSIENITLLAGLAAAEGIEAALGKKVRTEIKWPNDVQIAGKKVAGVLVEGRSMGRISIVVIGIGVNVAQSAADFPEELRDRATSCALAVGAAPDRIRVINEILSALESNAALLSANTWMPRWKQRCNMLGRRYVFKSAGQRLEAEIVDIDLTQGLVVRDAAGAMHFLHSATTTILS